jgi:two-component system alkaline phosphatase synthesis response regulator PhoP
MTNEKYKLLIVDDEPEICELLSYNFRKRGFDVRTATNGFTGLDVLKNYEPDIMILDILMPYVSGISMCKEVKSTSRFSKVPVYFLSATNNSELINAALVAGGEEFISKPVHIPKLINLVINKSIADFRENRKKNKSDFIDNLIEPGDF